MSYDYGYGYEDQYAEDYAEAPVDEMTYDEEDMMMEEEVEKPSMLLAISPVCMIAAGIVNYSKWSDTAYFDAWNQTYIYELAAGGAGLAGFAGAYVMGVAPLVDFGGYLQVALDLAGFFFIYKGNDNLSSDSSSTKISVGLASAGFLATAASFVLGGSAEEECMEGDEECEMMDDEAEQAAADDYADEVDPYGEDNYYGGYDY